MIMTELLASQQASDIEETTSVKEKTAMLSPPSRSVSAPHKNRILTNNSARNSAHVSVDNNSRTTTAFHNTGEDGSAGSKMFGSPVRRSFGKSSVSPVSQKKLSTNLPETSLLKIENEYAVKKKRYLSLKKDLLEKQKAAQNLYNEMSMLYEKLIANCNRDPGKPEIIKIIIGVTKYMPSSDHNNQNEHALIQVERLSIGQELLDSLESRLREIPRRSQSLCQELLRKQLSFVTFVTSHLINVSEDNKDTNSVSSILTLELEHYQKDYDDLRSRLKDIEVLEDRSVTELIQNIRRMIEEYESSRAKLIELNAADTQRELQVQLNTTAEELQAEKEKNVQGKDRLRQTETQLQRARTKIKELEAHVENDDGKIQQLQVSLKALESQVKQKELGMDNKLKEMQKVIKNSENLLNKVEKQRDSLEARLVELREKIAIKENEEMGKIKELSEKLSAATADALTERQKKMEIEEAFTDLRDRYKNLEEKSNQLCELAEKNKDLAIIEGNHTENEVRLFKELETTRDELEAQRRLILQLQQEKEEIVAVMHQAANRDEDKDSRENLAAELVFKSTELQNLMMKYSEVKKIAKNAQEKNGMLERQLEEIQARLHSQSVEGGSAGLSAHAIELQQEISDLRSNLAEVTQQKEEVEAALTQKQLELEQRDHVMRQQSKFLKARDELLEALNGKVQQENGELSTSNENNEYLEEVHKQIAAKTEALQELYTTLKNKQLQIMHLEKMVKLMEVQQDRAQAQRTRLENRIAQLELTLHRSKEQRYVRFHVNNEPDRIPQDFVGDTEQVSSRQPFDFHAFLRSRDYDSVAKGNLLHDTQRSGKTDHRPLHDYEDYTPQPTSSDDDQPYVCYRCRQEASVEKDESGWSNKNNFNDNTRESYLSNVAIVRNTINRHAFRGDSCFYDTPSTDRSRNDTSVIYDTHAESINVENSSRESQHFYHNDYNRYRYHRHRVSPLLLDNTNPRNVTF